MRGGSRLERVLGPPIGEAEREYAWLLFRYVSVVGAVAALLIAVVYALLGERLAAGAAAVSVLVLPVLGRTESVRTVERAMLIAAGVALLGAVGAAIELGGLSSPAAPWLVLPSVVAHMMAGRRVGLPVAGLTLLAAAAIVVFGHEPSPLPGESEQLEHLAQLERLEMSRLVSLALLVVATLFIAVAQERLKAMSLRRMEEANAVLARARDSAEATSRLKSEFVATVSHELRTPLNAIVGMNDLLLRTPLDDAQRDYARTASGAANALLVLVDDLLELSRLEAGRVVLSPAPSDLGEVADSVRQLLALRAAEKGLLLEVKVQDGLPAVLVDPARLRQILTNLVDNAVKFTPAGRVTLAVLAEEHEDDHARVRFTVEDTGIGIPPEKIEVIFERFRQGDSSTTRRYGGTGLGLAIAKDLLGLMGGTIAVRSRPGEGSTFTAEVVLRLARAPVVLHGTHVLLAEDNVVNERLAVAVLQSLGCSVDVARDGAEAVRMAIDGDYDVVLMDCHMPEMDGYRAAATIRERRGRALPILALTAAGSAEDLRRAEEAGMDALLRKPIDVDGIRTSLGRVVSQREQRSADERRLDPACS